MRAEWNVGRAATQIYNEDQNEHPNVFSEVQMSNYFLSYGHFETHRYLFQAKLIYPYGCYCLFSLPHIVADNRFWSGKNLVT